MTKEAAEQALGRAKKQLEHVQVASFDPGDPEEVVTHAFYAYENCIVAAAENEGIPWQKSHLDKVRIARLLHGQGTLRVDVGDLLEQLNEWR